MRGRFEKRKPHSWSSFAIRGIGKCAMPWLDIFRHSPRSRFVKQAASLLRDRFSQICAGSRRVCPRSIRLKNCSSEHAPAFAILRPFIRIVMAQASDFLPLVSDSGRGNSADGAWPLRALRRHLRVRHERAGFDAPRSRLVHHRFRFASKRTALPKLSATRRLDSAGPRHSSFAAADRRSGLQRGHSGEQSRARGGPAGSIFRR